MKKTIKFTPVYTSDDILCTIDKRNSVFIPQYLNLELYHTSNIYRNNIDHFIDQLDNNQIIYFGQIIREYLINVINQNTNDIIYIKSILLVQQNQINQLNETNYGVEKPKTITKRQFLNAIRNPKKR